jgi:hypothetical protein
MTRTIYIFEYFVDVEGILEEYYLTHGTEYITWKNFFHVYMDET